MVRSSVCLVDTHKDGAPKSPLVVTGSVHTDGTLRHTPHPTSAPLREDSLFFYSYDFPFTSSYLPLESRES